MFQAVRGPRHDIESLCFDRTAIDEARVERTGVEAGQRVAHLLQDHRIVGRLR
jgi:hypothetical protein